MGKNSDQGQITFSLQGTSMKFWFPNSLITKEIWSFIILFIEKKYGEK